MATPQEELEEIATRPFGQEARDRNNEQIRRDFQTRYIGAGIRR